MTRCVEASGGRPRATSSPGLLPLLAAAGIVVCAFDLLSPSMAWVALGRPRATAGPMPHAAGLAGSPERHFSSLAANPSAAACAALASAAAAAAAAAGRRRGARTARAADGNDGGARQLLGMKGASDEDVPLWKIRLQLCKPVTWPPLVLGCVCGTAATGNWTWEPQSFALLFAAMFISGPCLTGFTQTINDWYDREIDAINEPYRPIPSGKITESEVWQQIYALLFTGMGIGLALDAYVGHIPNGLPTVFLVAVVGVFLAYIYSAPPLKLKQNGWLGNYALGWSYVSLPWWCGQALFGEITTEIVLLTTFYAIGAIGIAIVNDFKSIEGDRALGLDSLPVMYGIDNAKLLTILLEDGVQLCIAAWLYYIGEPNYAAGLLALMVPQVIAQKTLLWEDPVANDVKFQASSLPFFQFGILTTALAIGNNPLH